MTDALGIELMHEGASVGVTLIRPEAIDAPPCAEHARNRSTRAVPCIEVVAWSILYANHPLREFTIGGSTLRAGVIAAGALPCAGALARHGTYAP